MSKLILIRHGQASFGNENYDQLSDLGIQQSRWLGEYFKSIELQPDVFMSGDLVRQQQTVSEIKQAGHFDAEILQDAGWNEFDFHTIGRSFLLQHPELAPNDRTARSFFVLLKQALLAWSEDRIEGELPETWAQFQARVQQLIESVFAEDSRKVIVAVSSGGVIAMALKLILRAENATAIDLNLQTRNTGITEIYFNRENRYLGSFNSTPHLASPDRQACITSA